MRLYALVVLVFFSLNVFADTFSSAFVAAAIERTNHPVRYDGSYFSIEYPNGDVPSHLRVFFERHGESLEISEDATLFRPGDLVTWVLPGNLPHIGIVTDQVNTETGRPLVSHNIGRGPELQDMLFTYDVTGHYRYVPEKCTE